MRHVRSLRFEALEGRALLSRGHLAAHHAPAHHAPARHTPAMVATPVSLDGTLSVDRKAANTLTNADGSTTTMTPVSGTLGVLGAVHGVWSEDVDAFGVYEGPDTIQLHGTTGGIVLDFNNGNPGKPHRTSTGAVSFQHPQHLGAGTGAYAHATESGTIDLNAPNARARISSITITTGPA